MLVRNGLFDSNFEDWFFDRWKKKWVLPVREEVKNDDLNSEIIVKKILKWKINTKCALNIVRFWSFLIEKKKKEQILFRFYFYFFTSSIEGAFSCVWGPTVILYWWQPNLVGVLPKNYQVGGWPNRVGACPSSVTLIWHSSNDILVNSLWLANNYYSFPVFLLDMYNLQ